MQQGLLFEPQTWAQAELRQAIERLDFAAAIHPRIIRGTY